jgi:hypothetical protein
MSFLDNIELEKDKENLNAAKSKAKLGRTNASKKSGKDEILEPKENLKAPRQRRMAVRNPNLDENSKQNDIDENSQRSKSKRNNKNRKSETNKPENRKNNEKESKNVVKQFESSRSKRIKKNRISETNKPEKTKNVEEKSEDVITKHRSVVRKFYVDRCKSQYCTFCKSKFENFKTFSKHIANEHAEKLQERKQLKVICSG